MLWELFLTFAKIGVMTFGGGMAMLPILEREIVQNKKWATEEELVDYFAIGQCTPGIIAVNTSVFIGHQLRKIRRPLSGRRKRVSSAALPQRSALYSPLLSSSRFSRD